MSTEGSSNTVGGGQAPAEPFVATSLGASFSVNDLEASVAWYHDVLGFAIDRRHERGGAVRAVSLSAGTARLLLTQDDGARGQDREKGQGFSLQFTTSQNIDDIAARIRAHGGKFDDEPTDMPWGVRVMRIRDPDGF
jgi:catechol 2,3-dioxygenase-like lactoylglutathione lyase family enzyme